MPHSTCESPGSSVVQTTTAPMAVTEVTPTAERTGGVRSFETVTETGAEVVEFPAPSRATAVSVWEPLA